jgi:hypothetical protein
MSLLATSAFMRSNGIDLPEKLSRTNLIQDNDFSDTCHLFILAREYDTVSSRQDAYECTFSSRRLAMDRRNAFSLLTGTALCSAFTQEAKAVQPESTPDHVKWVLQILERMERVKPGMTRSALSAVFSTEGGVSTALQSTFVSRACPYFKVDVTFRAVGRSDKDQQGRGTKIEDPHDEILSISRPYLAYMVVD